MISGINKDILKLALPSILANITVPIVGMVDIAVAGHLDTNAATMIGGIAIGTMLFDLLYWNFGFLRVGTGGLTAQAYGRKDAGSCSEILVRALGISLACALLLIAIQWLFVKAAFLVVDCTPEVRQLASQYFFIRIWAAPATLSLMAFKGWFIGMQDSVSAMAADLTVNVINIIASIVLAVGIKSLGFEGLGFRGIALGTVVAQYTGLLCVGGILATKYLRTTFAGFHLRNLGRIFTGEQTRRFFVMNADLFIRSLCFIGIYIGFTVISANYGDVLLAVSSIMMKLLMIFSYFTDGFAYAGEALAGKYIGAEDKPMLKLTVKYTFIWSMAVAAVFMIIYGVAGVPMLRMMTSDVTVIEASLEYIPWLMLMPIIGCAAFTWDGIYIGATASKQIRNSMLWAAACFFAFWIIGILILDPQASGFGQKAVHLLMAAYFVHLLARTVYLTVKYRSSVWDRL